MEISQLPPSWDPESNCCSSVTEQKAAQAASSSTFEGSEFQTLDCIRIVQFWPTSKNMCSTSAFPAPLVRCSPYSA